MEGTRIDDRYEIIRQLGQGAFARTLLAQDLRLNRPVAIKVLQPRPGDSLKSYELFEREAAVLRELRHPAVPARVVRASPLQFDEFGDDLALARRCEPVPRRVRVLLHLLAELIEAAIADSGTRGPQAPGVCVCMRITPRW